MEASEDRDRAEDAQLPSSAPALTVAAVARRLGVAPPTLRTWDRRYGLGPSAHTAGAHRRYSPADVARLMVMRRLTLEGVSSADAAKIAVATPVSVEGRPTLRAASTPANGYDFSADGAEPDADPERDPDQFDSQPWPDDADPADTARTPAAGEETSGESDWQVEDASDLFSDADLRSARRAEEADSEIEDAALNAPWRDEPGDGTETAWLGVLRSAGERSTPGGGRVVAMPDGTPRSRGLARAAMSLDTYETHRMLRDAVRRHGVVPTWNTMIMPVLRALGERTSATGDGIDVEHAFSEVTLGVLRAAADGLRQPPNSGTVLLACAESDLHSLPLHALAAALAEREIPTRMLGSGLPGHALSACVRRTGPSVIVLYARMPGADASDTYGLRRQRPSPTVILGGPGWRPETVPTFARTASSLAEAVGEVLLAVHA